MNKTIMIVTIVGVARGHKDVVAERVIEALIDDYNREVGVIAFSGGRVNWKAANAVRVGGVGDDPAMVEVATRDLEILIANPAHGEAIRVSPEDIPRLCQLLQATISPAPATTLPRRWWHEYKQRTDGHGCTICGEPRQHETHTQCPRGVRTPIQPGAEVAGAAQCVLPQGHEGEHES